jgi:hypothetical protein
MIQVPHLPSKEAKSSEKISNEKINSDSGEGNRNDINKSGRKKFSLVTNCKHTLLKHFAKGMCNHCYHRFGRKALADKCPHTDRKRYAKGKCQNCYINEYNKAKRHQKGTSKANLTINSNKR